MEKVKRIKGASRYLEQTTIDRFLDNCNENMRIKINIYRELGIREQEIEILFTNAKIAKEKGNEYFYIPTEKGSNDRCFSLVDNKCIMDLLNFDSISANSIKQYMSEISNKTGIYISSQDFRCTLATNLLLNGVSVIRVMGMFGWKSISSMEHYVKLANEKMTYLYQLGLSNHQYNNNVSYFDKCNELMIENTELRAKLAKYEKGDK